MTEYGKVRVEVIALLPAINEKIEQGQTVASIYRELKEKHKFTFTLSAFEKNVKNLQKNPPSGVRFPSSSARTRPALSVKSGAGRTTNNKQSPSSLPKASPPLPLTGTDADSFGIAKFDPNKTL